MPAFPSPNLDGPPAARRRHLSRIECHPSAISPALDQLSGAEPQVTAANPQPYFVPSTASASEVLTNVAIQDWFATEDADFYELVFHHYPTSSSSLASISDWDSLDFVNPFAREDSDDVYDSDFDLEDVEEETANEPSWLSPKPTTNSPSEYQALEPAYLPSSVQINKAIQLVSSSVVEVAFRNTRSDSPPGEDDDDGEEAVIVPVISFPHPHRLSTIIEEDEEVMEDSPRPEIEYEDQDDTSDAETIRPSGTLAHLGPVNDAGSDGRLGCANHGDFPCESSPHVQTDRRISI